MKNIKGYKNTQVGVIPNDWEIKTLKEISIGTGMYGIGASAVNFSEKLPRYLRITDINEEGRLLHDDPKSVDDTESHKYILNEHDIVFARTGNTTGKTYLYNSKDGVLVFAGFLIKFSINKEIACARFVKFFTETNFYKHWVRIMSMRSGQPGINGKEYAKLPMPMPKLKEQEKISTILSTWDKAIELKEKLIEKKKEQKKGLMQKLLTGEVRMPGFEGEWHHIRLGELVKLQGGFAFKSSLFQDKGIPIVRISDIETEITDSNFVYYDVIDLGDNYELTYGDIVIAMSGATTGKVGIYKRKDYAYLNQRVGKFVLIDKNKLSYDYLLYLVTSDKFKIQLKKELATGAQPNISSRQIENFKFKLPGLKEQKQIAEILSAIDRFIFLVENEVNQLKQQKKGLMQRLLTGKVRVKV